MRETLDRFADVKHEVEIGDTAAAILVLCEAIKESATFSSSNAENFGHELAIALKHVLENERFQVSVDGTIRTEE